MYQLVKELENDIIKAQPKYLDMETKHQILSCMFILRYDEIEIRRDSERRRGRRMPEAGPVKAG